MYTAIMVRLSSVYIYIFDEIGMNQCSYCRWSSFLHIYVFYKNKQTEKIAGRSVQTTMSCVFCFYLLPVLWHEKYVQMIKIFQSMLLFFSVLHSFISHIQGKPKKKKPIPWPTTCKLCNASCACLNASCDTGSKNQPECKNHRDLLLIEKQNSTVGASATGTKKKKQKWKSGCVFFPLHDTFTFTTNLFTLSLS